MAGDRFRFYASRIRVLIQRGFSRPRLSVDNGVLEALLHFTDASATPLMPRLRHLEIHYEDTQAASMVKLLMQPSVQTLQLSFENAQHDCILPQLLSRSNDGSTIRELSFAYPPDAVPEMRHMLLSGSWKALTHLDFMCTSHWLGQVPELLLDGRTLAFVGSLPALSSLGIYLTHDCIAEIPSHEQDLFLSLQSLTIRSLESLDVATDFLSRLRPRLTSLDVTYRQQALPNSFISFAGQLTQPSLRHRLTSLGVTTSGMDDNTESVLLPFPNQFFLALTTLSRLQSIKLNSDMQLCLTDDILCKMAASWPDLTCLSVLGRRPVILRDESDGDAGLAAAFSAPATFQGLAHFGTHCPKLVVLELVIDTQRYPLPPQESLTAPPSEPSPVTEDNITKDEEEIEKNMPIPTSTPGVMLYILNTPPPADRLEEIASLLSRSFPHLKWIGSMVRRDDWDRLHDLVLAQGSRT
jgi:hypothetical protein